MTEQTSALVGAIAAILALVALRYLEGLLKRLSGKQDLDTSASPEEW